MGRRNEHTQPNYFKSIFEYFFAWKAHCKYIQINKEQCTRNKKVIFFQIRAPLEYENCKFHRFPMYFNVIGMIFIFENESHFGMATLQLPTPMNCPLNDH